MDLVRARSKVMVEALKSKTKQIQSLLWPLEMEMDDPDLLERLQGIGVECRCVGKRRLAVDALPSVLDPSDLASFITHWREGKTIEAASSRLSYQANKKFSLDEAAHLWSCLQNCPDCLYDPLGRKIWETISLQDLETWIDRG